MDRNKDKWRRRLRRKRTTRKKVRGTETRPRLTVTRSNKNIQCQIIDDDKGVTLLSASSLVPALKQEVGTNGGNRKGAEIVARHVAERLKELGIERLNFDRNGYRYHGRVAVVAETLRKEGVQV